MWSEEYHSHGVFSAHAEVVPYRLRLNPQEKRILRARGGSSTISGVSTGHYLYSPRTRR